MLQRHKDEIRAETGTVFSMLSFCLVEALGLVASFGQVQQKLTAGGVHVVRTGSLSLSVQRTQTPGCACNCKRGINTLRGLGGFGEGSSAGNEAPRASKTVQGRAQQLVVSIEGLWASWSGSRAQGCHDWRGFM